MAIIFYNMYKGGKLKEIYTITMAKGTNKTD